MATIKTQFDDDTAVTRLDAETFSAKIQPSWWVAFGPNGGYLAAIILRSMYQMLSDEAWQPISLTLQYTEAAAVGACQVITHVERKGRSLATLSARLVQGDRLCVLALAAFSLPRVGAITFAERVMPAVPSPDQIPPMAAAETFPAFTGRFDYRWAIGDPPFSGSARAEVGGWIRLAEPRPIDSLLVAAFLDCWVPAVFPRLTHQEAVPTVDLTIHFRARLPLPDCGEHDFALGVFTSHFATGGFFEEDGELWSANGILLAHSRQLAILRAG
jgi:acyl-CoA thioesterase